MEEKIQDYLIWKSSYAKSASISYRSPLLNIRKLDSLADVIEFKNSIEGKYSESTVAYAMTVLRDFIKYLNATNQTTIPHDLIKIPRFVQKRRTVSNRDDVIKMLSILDDSKFTELRNRIIIRMLADTGIRVSELVNLNISDLDGKTALIRTKKSTTERVIMWSDQTNKELLKYLGPRICINSTEPLFVSMFPKYPRITTRQVERIIETIGKKAKLKKNLTPHSFRHGKAHDMLDKGANVKEIQSVLGHSETNPRAAFQYIKLANHEQKSILKKFV
jgi:integrase/recombinase XerD